MVRAILAGRKTMTRRVAKPKFDKWQGLARIGSTATLSTVEFERLMSEIRMWASDQGVFIPEPNEEIY